MNLKKKFDIAEFCERMEQHLGGQEGEAQLFWKALSFAVSAHQDQKRKSGEAYVSHPCQVAQILVEELDVNDPATLAAAVLHDTMEDVPEVTNEVIGELFGKNVEAIVEGCTKITEFDGDRQTFYKLVHRKIFSGAADRIEIMLVKLADRLHNLRTLYSLPKHKRQKIADETLDVYAPMAKVMGLYRLKRELYDLALTYKFPRQSHKVEVGIRQMAEEEGVLSIIKRLKEEMEKAWVTCEVEIRSKGLWAYFDPVKRVLIKDIETPIEILIATDDVQTCYRALGILNQTFPPIPRTLRDFVANPKPTGYQSLHTRANIRGRNYLFKIRTKEMLKSGRSGIIREWAAHRKAPNSFEKDIREMFDILGTDDGLSYRDMIAASGKNEIYTYTPKGKKISLPRQSTVLDFAFKIHTEIGSRCMHARIGGKIVQPDHIVRDGDQVEVICQEEPVFFDPGILELCQTPRARAELARMFRMRREDLAEKTGEALIKQELKWYAIPFHILEKDEVADLLVYFDLESLDELFLRLGEGTLRLKELIFEISNGLYANQKTLEPPTGVLNRIDLDSLDPACIKLSQCCNPIPTEKGLIGLLSERGLSVHKNECTKVRSLKLQREDVVELRWRLKETTVRKPQTLLFLKVVPRNRLLMLLGVAPEEMKIINIISLSSSPASSSLWEINFTVDTLYGLRSILTHFNRAGIEFDFELVL